MPLYYNTINAQLVHAAMDLDYHLDEFLRDPALF